jgi:hypothetical protein
MMTMKTIGRNRTKAIEMIFTNATECRAYTLSNGFLGHDCEVKFARQAFEQANHAKLQDMGNGRFCVRMHSNCWYEFKSH